MTKFIRCDFCGKEEQTEFLASHRSAELKLVNLYDVGIKLDLCSVCKELTRIWITDTIRRLKR